MNIALIGNGAIAQYVKTQLTARGHHIAALLVRKDRLHDIAVEEHPVKVVEAVADLPHDIQHVIDCAGHSGLRDYGEEILRTRSDLTTVSIGALADEKLLVALDQAAYDGRSQLHLASGAVGSLDCLRAARVGKLDSVRYTGRKPPAGWVGSPAEAKLDLKALHGTPQTHFRGSAREAAIEYPKNANVAAAVALSGIGFDRTEVELVADPNLTQNVHEISAIGEFGEFSFRISGRTLADNPRSAALAAMSVVSSLEQSTGRLVF